MKEHYNIVTAAVADVNAISLAVAVEVIVAMVPVIVMKILIVVQKIVGVAVAV
jgi:hypothetical protein